MKIVEVPRERALPEVLRRVAQTDVVLDVGPGIQPQSYFRPRTHICVEAHAPYVERLRADRAGDPGWCACAAPGSRYSPTCRTTRWTRRSRWT